MKAIIKRIEMQNFKGFASASRDFNEQEEVLTAENGKGKSTFRYAFLWVLGYDVPDVIPMFENKEIPELEIKVSLVMDIDGNEYKFERLQKEIWTVSKETGERSKTGNKSTFWLDSIPYEGSQREYKEKVATIFGTVYSNLEILINKDYFNSDSLNWKDRRKILFDLCNVGDLLEKLAEKPEYNLIKTEVKKGYSSIEIKKILTKERNTLKSKQENNNIIILDSQNDLAKYSDVDLEMLNAQKIKMYSKLTRLQSQIREESITEILEEKNAELAKVITEISRLQIADSKASMERQRELRATYDELAKLKTEGDFLNSDIDSLKRKIEHLEGAETASIFQGTEVCPTCGQDLPADQIEKARQDFEKDKEKEIAGKKATIEGLKSQVLEMEKSRTELKTRYEALRRKYSDFKEQVDKIPENSKIAELEANKSEIQEGILNLKEKEVNSETAEKVKTAQAELEALLEKLSYQTVVDNINSKIFTLREDNKEIADNIASLDLKERQLNAFVKEQISLVNDTINSKFSGGVSFTLFNELYKGGEGGLEETCVCMLDGKRYSSLSTGEKYYADLEVVKSLQEQFGSNLPIFCDNAEAVTRDLKSEQQIIKMFALKEKKLEGVIPITSILK